MYLGCYSDVSLGVFPIPSTICLFSQDVALTVPVVRVHPGWVRDIDIVTTAHFKIVCATGA
jgi:hypothetical protein